MSDWISKHRTLVIVLGCAGIVGSLATIWYMRRESILEMVKKEARNNKEMIERLRHMMVLSHPQAIKAMLAVDRKNFVQSENPYQESALPIGYNATISAPHMHALGLDLLVEYIKPGAKVLDVGSGSGFMLACFAYLVGENGTVYGIDHIKVGDGFEGIEEHAPFDVIYVGAAAPEIPPKLLSQLKPNGVILIPVGPPHGFHKLLRAQKLSDGNIKVRDFGSVRFVPLTSKQNQIDGSVRGGIAKMVTSEDGSRVIVQPHIVPAPDSSPSEYFIQLPSK